MSRFFIICFAFFLSLTSCKYSDTKKNNRDENTNAGIVRQWGKKNDSLRIYWRSLEKWSKIILDLAKERNKNIIYGFESIYDLDPNIKKIPIQDLEEIMNILVEKKIARWIEYENNILKIL